MELRKVTNYLNTAELFVEVHHIRGNISKFEMYNGHEWHPMAPVENMRAMPDGSWKMLALGERILLADGRKNIRVTRYPDMEQGWEDTTYDSIVPAWKIDIDKVTEFLNE